MNTVKIFMSLQPRRLAARAVLIAALTGLLVFSFLSGKGHTILIDNKDAENGAVPAVDGVLVTINKMEELELYSGDRDMQKVKGQKHIVKIEIINDSVKIEKLITLPLMTEMMLLSVPKLAAGIEPFMEEFIPLDMAPPPDDNIGNTNAYTSPDAVPEPVPVF